MGIVLFIFFSSFIMHLLLIKYGHKFYYKKFYYSEVQNINPNSTSRIGGFNIFFIFFLISILINNQSLLWFFFASFILLPALMEDLGIIIKALYRFYSTLLGSFLIVFILIETYPNFDLGILNIVLNNNIFQIVFFTFALTAMVNGQNIIDGTNGLSAFTSLTIYSSLLYLGVEINDEVLIQKSIIIITLLISFLLLNYPYGKIFLGDMGSYFLGLYAGYLVIDTYGKNNQLASWSAVIILFYPIMEVIFSYFRKIFEKKSPLKPDSGHLHLKIFFLISKREPNRLLYNSIVAPILSIIWLTPFFLFTLTLSFPEYSLLALIVLVGVYLVFYYLIPRVK